MFHRRPLLTPESRETFIRQRVSLQQILKTSVDVNPPVTDTILCLRRLLTYSHTLVTCPLGFRGLGFSKDTSSEYRTCRTLSISEYRTCRTLSISKSTTRICLRISICREYFRRAESVDMTTFLSLAPTVSSQPLKMFLMLFLDSFYHATRRHVQSCPLSSRAGRLVHNFNSGIPAVREKTRSFLISTPMRVQ